MKRRTVATISGLALAYQASRTAAWSLSSSSWSSRVSLSSISSRPRSPRHPPILAMSSTDEDIDLDSPHLPPELEMMTKPFAPIPDEKTRHKQLLYMASKLEEVGDEVRVPENKVPGCLSTVHVDCVLVPGEERGGDEVVRYFGDSDGLLTKGLLALLIRCVLRSGGFLECCCFCGSHHYSLFFTLCFRLPAILDVDCFSNIFLLLNFFCVLVMPKNYELTINTRRQTNI